MKQEEKERGVIIIGCPSAGTIAARSIADFAMILAHETREEAHELSLTITREMIDENDTLELLQEKATKNYPTYRIQQHTMKIHKNVPFHRKGHRQSRRIRNQEGR